MKAAGLRYHDLARKPVTVSHIACGHGHFGAVTEDIVGFVGGRSEEPVYTEPQVVCVTGKSPAAGEAGCAVGRGNFSARLQP